MLYVLDILESNWKDTLKIVGLWGFDVFKAWIIFHIGGFGWVEERDAENGFVWLMNGIVGCFWQYLWDSWFRKEIFSSDRLSIDNVVLCLQRPYSPNAEYFGALKCNSVEIGFRLGWSDFKNPVLVTTTKVRRAVIFFGKTLIVARGSWPGCKVHLSNWLRAEHS